MAPDNNDGEIMRDPHTKAKRWTVFKKNQEINVSISSEGNPELLNDPESVKKHKVEGENE